MDKKLIEQYKKYAKTEEAFAILFVKKYLNASKNKWVKINDIAYSRHFHAEKLEFKGVTCELFDRKIRPEYPPASKFDSEYYTLTCRAITWKTANEDIYEQECNGIHGVKYKLEGLIYNANKGGLFVENVPAEIKALAENSNDRTDPLWDIAINYIREDNYRFKMKKVTRIG